MNLVVNIKGEREREGVKETGGLQNFLIIPLKWGNKKGTGSSNENGYGGGGGGGNSSIKSTTLQKFSLKYYVY